MNEEIARSHLQDLTLRKKQDAEVHRLEKQLAGQRRILLWLPWALMLVLGCAAGIIWLQVEAAGRINPKLLLAFAPMLGYPFILGLALHVRLRALVRLIELEAPGYHARLKKSKLI